MATPTYSGGMRSPAPVSRRTLLGAAALGALGLAATGSGWPRATMMLQGATPAQVTPTPLRSLVSRWDINPWARGSYSALPVGTDSSVRQVLASALMGGRIVLAGEYCDPGHPSTTTGAYSSGVRAARRLLRNSPRSVVVIGAGMAGAAAARTLADAGVSVTVLEASGRVGGRILTNESWGRPVEMGAAWIHDWQPNPITTLARNADLPLRVTNYDDSVVRDTVTGRVSSAGAQADDRLAAAIDSIGDAEPSRLTSVATWLRRRDLARGRFDQWATATELTQEYGLDPARLGQQAQTEGSSNDSGDVLVGGGYSQLVSELLSGIMVSRRSPVTAVNADARGVDLRVNDGRVLRADAVVVAVPLALLQARLPAISPWPRAVAGAVAGLTTGNLEKVVLQYERRWWGSHQVLGMVGGGVAGAPAGSVAALRWTEMFDLTDLLGVPSLVAFSGGAAARARPRTNAGCVAEVVAVLNAAYRG